MHRIETERLILRPWRSRDREPFAALNAHPEVTEHFGAPLDRRQSDALADRIADHIVDHGWGLWAVEVPEMTEFAGFVGLARPRFDAQFTPAVEVGWRLDRAWWGRGYATEAAEAAVAFGFVELDLDEIVSFTAPTNTRSRAVMERLGMGHKPSDDFDHPGLPDGHPLRRHVLYRLSRSAWLTSGRGYAPTPRAIFLRSLPRKRMAAGCLLTDGEGRVMIVKPTYKDGWDIPGGMVDNGESPHTAVRRELEEELGLDLRPGPLLCVDYNGDQPGYLESLMFVFDGGTLERSQIDRIVLPEEELSEFRFVTRTEARTMLRSRVARRVDAVWDLLGTGRGIYLDEQQSPR